MNPIHQCFQKISPGNHFSYVRDRTYGTYGRTDKGDAICPPIINGGGIKTNRPCASQICIGVIIVLSIKTQSLCDVLIGRRLNEITPTDDWTFYDKPWGMD